MHTLKVIGPLVIATAVIAASAAIANAQKKNVEGVTNFTQLDSTIACAGATRASAVPELKSMGFASIVNLRLPTEEGADIEAEKAAAAAAGIKYYHVPFNLQVPNPEASVAEFLKVTGDRSNQPYFVHCAGGGRASAMWLIKRVMLDGWDVNKAKAEADLVNAGPNKSVDWAMEYVKTHKK
jgi:uncharacterized protein (TIGR01244 family)